MKLLKDPYTPDKPLEMMDEYPIEDGPAPDVGDDRLPLWREKSLKKRAKAINRTT
jgi:hypothetical protein